MPNVLAIDPGTPRSLLGISPLGERLSVEIAASPRLYLERAALETYDLLVLAGFSVDEQQQIVSAFHAHRRWRLVPVLYATDPATPGLAIPGTFRPEIDGLVRGTIGSLPLQKKIVEMAREGVSGADMVVAGPFELDPVRGKLRLADLEVSFTDRESEILAMLLAHPNHTVSASEIIERGWGSEADPRYLQILRRHVSNIRRKLEQTSASRSVRTVRGSGYRFDLKVAG